MTGLILEGIRKRFGETVALDGISLEIGTGEFVSLVGGSGTHIGLVSDRRGPNGPLIIHNIGRGAREEDALLAWPITGRYRWSID